MKAQELLLNDTLANASGQQRLKSRGGSHPRTIGNNTQVVQLSNKISGNAVNRGRTITDNPFEVAAGSAKNHTFETVNVKQFSTAKKDEPKSGAKV